MKIGILTHNFPRNKNERKDAGVFLMDFADEISKEFDVRVLSPDFGGSKNKDNKIQVTWFSWSGPRKKLGDWNMLSVFSVFYFFKLLLVGSKKAVSFVKNNNIDYCLAAWSIPSGVYAYVVKKIVGTPYGVWNLGSDINKYSKLPILNTLIKLSLKNADHVFANSLDLSNKINILCNRRVVFLPAVTKFSFVHKKNIKLTNSNFKFVFVGRLEMVKGPDVLLKAISNLKKAHPNLNFSVNILGGGTMEKKLKNEIRTLDLYDQVKMIGWADESMVSRYMGMSDCLIVPSRSESLPLVILEAAKSKLPVIAANVGDCSFLLKKYKIGLSFEKENYIDLSECMFKMINSKWSGKGDFVKLSNDYSLKKSAEMFSKIVILTQKI